MFVVAGVSGNTGSVVADSLLARGKKVRVVVRDAAKGEPWKKKGAEVAIAALDDAQALGKALAGAEGAYLLSPPDMGATDFLAQRKKTLDAIAEAIDAAKVPHVVFLSSVGAQHADGTGIIKSVHGAEQRLGRTSAKTSFVRAAYFLENWGAVLGAVTGAGHLPTFLPPDLRIPMVASKDIGLVAANTLLEGPPSGKSQILELAGPKDYSSRDLAEVLAKVVGKPVELQAAPTDAVVPTFTGFGISANIAELFRQMYVGIADGTVAFEGNGARQVRGSIDAETFFRGALAS